MFSSFVIKKHICTRFFSGGANTKKSGIPVWFRTFFLKKISEVHRMQVCLEDDHGIAQQRYRIHLKGWQNLGIKRVFTVYVHMYIYIYVKMYISIHV